MASLYTSFLLTEFKFLMTTWFSLLRSLITPLSMAPTAEPLQKLVMNKKATDNSLRLMAICKNNFNENIFK